MAASILVTGATGMVGSAFARRAIEAGYPVRALVRRDSNRRALDALTIDYVEGDLAEPESLRAALAPRRSAKRFRTTTFAMGKPAVPIDKALRLAAELEDEEIIRKLALRK